MSKLPPLRHFKTENECRKYFEQFYCTNPVITFDGINVYFYPEKFDDAFFESKEHKKRDKSIFSIDRASKIDWIKYVLENPKAEIFEGWDRDKKIPRKDRRVAIISPENYMVVITILNNNKAKFITAYTVDGWDSILKIKASKKYKKNDH
ncbi:MAG: hypothetical protein HFI86_04580 [Bacilli bacterium]|nr:hypothetical protein [Bacilli bacterium]